MSGKCPGLDRSIYGFPGIAHIECLTTLYHYQCEQYGIRNITQKQNKIYVCVVSLRMLLPSGPPISKAPTKIFVISSYIAL